MPRPLTLTGTSCPHASQREECRPIVKAEARLWATRSSRHRGALIGVQPLGPHLQRIARNLPRSSRERRPGWFS